GRRPPKTHNIRFLVGEVKSFTDFPSYLEEVAKLSRYAFEVRYPDDYLPVKSTRRHTKLQRKFWSGLRK
ncbi:MAG: HEPN domain-containing protein, partial [Thermotogae bacterium]|nr:HEPN domain-containing protein [Thermotogota bacterium]